LATPNYGYEKRQRELAKKKKKEEKLKAKAAGKHHDESGQELDAEQGVAPDAAGPDSGPAGDAGGSAA
jgi:hypothetical protein